MADESGGNRGPQHPAQADADEAETAAGEQASRSRSLDDDVPPPPARPKLSDQTKPPVLRTYPAPWPVKLARALWLLSFLLGAGAVFLSFVSGESLIAELTEVLGRLAPGYEADEVASLVDVIYWTSLAGLGVVIALEAILLAAILNRRGGARWLQLLVLVLHAVAVLVGSAFLAIGDWGGLIDGLLIVGFALAVVGWALCLFPAAHRWFRMDQSQAASLD